LQNIEDSGKVVQLRISQTRPIGG